MATLAGILRAADDYGLLALARYVVTEPDAATHPTVIGVFNHVLGALHDEAHRRCEIGALEASWRLPPA